MVRVTGNFTSESPLHPAASEAIAAAFDQGWADPKKLSQRAAKAAILRDQAVESIAVRLQIPANSIEVLGEPALGPYLAIAGLLNSDSLLSYGATDKGKIRAIARSHSGEVREIPVDKTGHLIRAAKSAGHSVLSLQTVNGETGAIQDVEEFVGSATEISIDATASGPLTALPSQWSTALFDSTSWQGPSGLSILAISAKAKWKYPLPHISPIRTPGSYSLPLLLASAVALDEFTYEKDIFEAQQRRIVSSLTALPDVIHVATEGLPHLNSFIVGGIANEQLIRALSEVGVDIDGGSACNPEDLQPSHVIAAMGYPTSGHIRITLHAGISEEDINVLIASFQKLIPELRR